MAREQSRPVRRSRKPLPLIGSSTPCHERRASSAVKSLHVLETPTSVPSRPIVMQDYKFTNDLNISALLESVIENRFFIR